MDIEGDLLETYENRLDKVGRVKANRLLYKDILLLFRPGIIRSFSANSRKNYSGMLQNHLKITWRTLFRKKATSFFGISGLGLGLACTIGIFLWVSYELSYNRFHEKGSNIFLVELLLEGLEKSVVSPAPLAESLVTEYPEIINASRYSVFHQGRLLKVGDKQMVEKGAKVDASFFEMFDFKLKEGNIRNFKQNAILLSQQVAMKYFGDKDPVGQLIVIDNEESYEVSGILEDIPKNSSFQFDFLIPFVPEAKQNWGAWFCGTFIQLSDKTGPQEILSRTSGFKTFYDKINKSRWSSELVAISDIYFHDKMEPFFSKSGDKKYLLIFSIAGVLIFSLSCLNYVSLSTSRFVARFRQIGLAKILGAGNWHTVHKYFVEASTHTFLALIFAVVLLLLFFFFFVSAGIDDMLTALGTKEIVGVMLGAVAATITLTTLIPSIILISVEPIALLRKVNQLKPFDLSLRRSLVIFQFCISICMIIGMSIFQKQLMFIQNKDLGYQKENVVAINLNDKTSRTLEAFKNKLLQHSNILNVSQSTFEHIYFDTKVSDWEGKIREGSITIRPMTADDEFLETLSIELIEGSFHKSLHSNDQAVVINQEAARQMEMSAPVGKKVTLPWGKTESTIVGVVKDFNYWGLTSAIEPVFIFNGNSGNVFVRMGENDIEATLAFIAATFKELNPDYPIEYTLLEDRYRTQHASHQQAGRIFRVFSVIAVIISCLSLLAMITFMVEQKTMEIGIRKVHGASSWNIVQLMLSGFMRYVVIAFILATPITWFAMEKWLQIFAYRTDLSAEQFLAGGLAAVLATILTTTFHTMKAALSNPVQSLRDE